MRLTIVGFIRLFIFCLCMGLRKNREEKHAKKIDQSIKDDHIKKHKNNHPKKHKKSHVKIIFWLIVIGATIAVSIFYETVGPYVQSKVTNFEGFLEEYSNLFLIYDHLKTHIGGPTLLGVGYIMFLLSLFFIPAPIEAVFIGYLVRTNLNPFLLVGMSTLATTLGQFIDYIIGIIFGAAILKDKHPSHGMHKFVKWFKDKGTPFLWVFNILPLPAQPASVVFGLIKYPPNKFIWITITARLIKFAIILTVFFYSKDWLLSLFSL